MGTFAPVYATQYAAESEDEEIRRLALTEFLECQDCGEHFLKLVVEENGRRCPNCGACDDDGTGA